MSQSMPMVGGLAELSLKVTPRPPTRSVRLTPPTGDTAAAPRSYEKSPWFAQPLVVSRRRAANVPYGRCPSAYAGTKVQFVWKPLAPSWTQWPAVQTVLRLLLSTAVPEHTNRVPPAGEKTLPLVLVGW